MSKLSCEIAERYAHEGRRGRLGESEAASLAEHLASCAACRELHRRETALDTALERLPRARAPEALLARLRDMAEADPTHDAEPALAAPPPRAVAPPPPRRPARLLAFGSALVAAAALFGFFVGKHQLGLAPAGSLLAEEAVGDHLRVLYADRGPEIESGGIHQVKPWFAGRLDFAPVLPFDGDDEFALQGGSIAYFRDRKAAAFVFKHRLHRITLLVFRADGLELPSTATHQSSRGFDVVLWRHNELGYALVSDMAGSELDRLAAKIGTASAK
ncbi:MAG TPA: hypothetical protein VEQ59_22755 [Polyangiaceae bacterium]|nr:hypothetical protein [Polyangiaceae bacterium]